MKMFLRGQENHFKSLFSQVKSLFSVNQDPNRANDQLMTKEATP